MSNKKNAVFFTLGTIIITIIFFTSFFFTLNKLQNSNGSKEDGDVTVASDNYEAISGDTKIVLKTKDGKGVEKEEKQLYFKDIESELGEKKDNAALQQYFQNQNYYFKPTGDGNLVFIRKIFIPNRYYIGVKNKDNIEYLTIYKADSSGMLFIEDEKKDIINFSIDRIPNKDEQEMYRKGYGKEDGSGFASRNEAMEILTSFNIK